MHNKHPHHYFERHELHAFILMMAHSCIRVDECLNLKWGDCVEPPENVKLKKLKQFRDCTVQIRIRDGKVGYRHALGMHGAVWALQYLRELTPVRSHVEHGRMSTIAGTSMMSLEKYYLRHLKAPHIQKRLIDAALAAD
jgi:hypothetical protein